MITGERKRVLSPYGKQIPFVIAYNSQCQGIYFLGELCGFNNKAHYTSEFGDSSELYINFNKEQWLTDEQLLHIGQVILDVHSVAFESGGIQKQFELQKVLGLYNGELRYDLKGRRQ